MKKAARSWGPPTLDKMSSSRAEALFLELLPHRRSCRSRPQMCQTEWDQVFICFIYCNDPSFKVFLCPLGSFLHVKASALVWSLGCAVVGGTARWHPCKNELSELRTKSLASFYACFESVVKFYRETICGNSMQYNSNAPMPP